MLDPYFVIPRACLHIDPKQETKPSISALNRHRKFPVLKDGLNGIPRCQAGCSDQAYVSLPDNLWPVEIDEGQISQVINNLIINAKQAMPKGGLLKVKAENTAVDGEHLMPLTKGDYVKLSIEDQGVGISPEHLPRIFDPYFTTKERGSGLGLATSYSIIKKHNGYITVESKPGEGARFFIYLPASRKETSTTGNEEERPLKPLFPVVIPMT